MKKIKIDIRLKLGVTGLFIVGIILLSLQAIKESRNIGVEQQEKIKYEYTMGTEINYAVNLLPNILYDTEKIYEDETYISEFIKSINVNFKLNFRGSEPTIIDGNYNVIAQIAGYTTQQEAKKDIWTKDFELVPTTSIKGEEQCELQKLVVIDYHKYNDLAQAIIEASKVNVPVELRIIMKGEVHGDTEYEPITKNIATTLVMPLGNPYFNMQKLGAEQVTDTIKDVVEVPIPPNSKMITQCIIGIVLFIVLIILLWVLTIPLDATDIRKKEIDKILKNHSSRLVAVDTVIEDNAQETYEVKNIDDLVKIADELEKPIIYQYNRNVLKISFFYVMDKEHRYVYRILTEPAKQSLLETISDELQEQVKEESF